MSLPSPTALAHAIRFDGRTADELALSHSTNRQRIIDQLACGGFDATGYKHNGQVQGQRKRRLKDSDNGHRGGYVHGTDRPVSTEPARYGPPPPTRDPGIDWKADTKNGVVRKPHCRWCGKPAEDLVDDMCAACREAATEPFRMPDTPEVETADIGEEVIPTDVTPEPDDLVQQVRHLYLEEKLSRDGVAATLGISTRSVHRIIKRHSILRPPAPALDEAPGPAKDAAHRYRCKGKLAPHVEEILRRYRAGDSTVVLGRAYGVSPASITQLLKRLGEPRRSVAEAALRRTNKPPKEGKQGKPTPRSSAPRPDQASSTTRTAREAGPSATEEETASAGSGDAPRPAEVAPLASERRDLPLRGGPVTDGPGLHAAVAHLRAARACLAAELARIDAALAALDTLYLGAPETPRRPSETAPLSPNAAPASQAAAGAPTPARRRASHVDTAAIVARYTDGQTIPAIAEATGHGRMTIRRHLTSAGVQLRDDRATHSGGQPKDYDPDLVETMRRLYVDQQLSQAEVAEQVGTSIKVVQNVMARQSITARPAAHIAGARPGTDQARPLKQRIADLGVTSLDIKTWAHQQGLIDSIKCGLPKARLVTAYEAAHQQAGATA